MKVLSVQSRRMPVEDVPGYIGTLEREIDGMEFDLMVLPEKWVTTELPEHESQLPEIIGAFRDISKAHSCILVPGSFSILRNASLFNSAPVLWNGQLLGFQDKISLFLNENGKYASGNEIRTFKAGDTTISVPVCYDLDFPYYAKIAIDRGADMMINPSLITANFRDMWHIYVRGRSLENRLPVVSVNSLSDPFGGGSITTAMHPENGGIILNATVMEKEHMTLSETDVAGMRKFIRARRNEDPGFYDLDTQ